MFNTNLDRNQILRVIEDLGVDEPQVVENPFDKKILKYFERYPVTEYIREVIKIMENEVIRLSKIIDSENQKNEVANEEVYEKVNNIESTLMKLKKTDDLFVYRDNYNPPDCFEELTESILNKIKMWRNRKTKVTGTEEISSAAMEYNNAIEEYMVDFESAVKQAYEENKRIIEKSLIDKYNSQGVNTEFIPKNDAGSIIKIKKFPSIYPTLIETKEISYENPKNDLLNIFSKPSANKQDDVKVETCYLELWRNIAEKKARPLINEYIRVCKESLESYYNEMSEQLHKQLSILISENNSDMNIALAQMSADDRQHKEDNNWVHAFRYRIEQIERG